MHIGAIIAFALAFAVTAPSGASDRAGTRERPAGYDPALEVVLDGTVLQVRKHVHEGPPTVHLLLFSGTRNVEVHLAPPYFLNRHYSHSRLALT